ncbi:SCO3242 family prenyltransferase [Streptomyces parvus]|uniref:SCO3242 family prenyltransferase n=1 Tax=Streptomyces parvus TaxID=66428 RepID=UPI003D74D129
MRRRGRALPAALVAALAALPAGPGRRNGFAHGVRKDAVTHDSLSGAGGTAPAPDRPGPPPTGRNGERGADAGTGRADVPSERRADRDADLSVDRGSPRERLRAWAELLRVSALFSVPGDALAGAAAVGRRPGRGTALAIGASLCLYEAGMALNDWADRDEDAIDRPHRPIPSGRISPAAALGAAGVLTAAGLALAARAGRPALTVATGLAATVWAYDVHLKHTKAGPAAMAAARSLDLMLGATASAAGTAKVTAPRAGTPGGGGLSDNVAGVTAAATAGMVPTPGTLTASLPALPAALVLGAHTYGVTVVSRHEAQGGSTGTPLAVLATTTALAAAVLGGGERSSWATARGSAPQPGGTPGQDLFGQDLSGRGLSGRATDPLRLLVIVLTGAYLRTAGPPLLHAALNPSPPLTQRAVGGGIRAMIPLQAALAARAGSPVTGLAVMGLVPLARSLARKVSLT